MAILEQDSSHTGACSEKTIKSGIRCKGPVWMGLIALLFLCCVSPNTLGVNENSQKKDRSAMTAVPAVAGVSSVIAPAVPAVAASASNPSVSPSGLIPLKISAFKLPTMTVQAKQAYLIDLSTHSVLFEKNADQMMAPSSMTKIVTVYLMLQALAQKSLAWSDMIYVSKNAAGKPGSRMFIKPEESIPVIDLLKGIVVTSGNDACTAIAEHLGGSEEGFAELMNALTLSIGMTNSHFANASGLPDDSHYSTCKDLAVIAERTLTDFPKEYAQFYKLTSFKFNGIQQPNRNDLLKGGFADGMKTGMTDAGKYGIVATAIRPGYPPRRLLLVLNGVASASLRTAEARRLLNWGFQRFESLVVPKGRHVATLTLWKEGSVNLVTKSDLAITLPKGTLHRAKIVARYQQPLTPPILKGQKMGELLIHIDGQPPMVMPLVAQNDVVAPGWLTVIKDLFIKKPA